MGGIGHCGAVYLYAYDTAAGQSVLQSFLQPGSSGLPGSCENGSLFGNSLAAGDFNGDGRDDLAVGVPRRNTAGQFHSGAVYVLLGSPLGITAGGSVVVTVENLGLTPEIEDYFRAFVASGRLDGDAVDDLIVGSPRRVVGSPVPISAGAVTIFWGAAIGSPLALALDIGPGMIGGEASEGSDGFGGGLAVADFDGDGQSDLAISAPSESDGALTFVGVAHVVHGPVSPASVTTAHPLIPDSGYASWPRASHQAYGLPLVALDLDADANADLALAITGHDRTAVNAGLVQVLFGALFATGFERGDPEDWTLSFAP